MKLFLLIIFIVALFTEILPDGEDYLVSDIDMCMQIMMQRGFALVHYWQDENQATVSHCQFITGYIKSVAQIGRKPFYSIKENVNEILLYKIRAGSGQLVYETVLSNNFSENLYLFPRTNASFSSSYYKSPWWNVRQSLNIQDVRVGMFSNSFVSQADCELTFKHANGSSGEWFTLDNLIGHVYYDPWDSETIIDLRRLFVNTYYDSCPADIGLFVVLDRFPEDCDYFTSATGKDDIPQFSCAATWCETYGDDPLWDNYATSMSELEIKAVLKKSGKSAFWPQRETLWTCS